MTGQNNMNTQRLLLPLNHYLREITFGDGELLLLRLQAKPGRTPLVLPLDPAKARRLAHYRFIVMETTEGVTLNVTVKGKQGRLLIAHRVLMQVEDPKERAQFVSFLTDILPPKGIGIEFGNIYVETDKDNAISISRPRGTPVYGINPIFFQRTAHRNRESAIFEWRIELGITSRDPNQP